MKANVCQSLTEEPSRLTFQRVISGVLAGGEWWWGGGGGRRENRSHRPDFIISVLK